MGPNFGDTLNGGTVINVHGEETRLITARLAYAAPDLERALRAAWGALRDEGYGPGCYPYDDITKAIQLSEEE